MKIFQGIGRNVIMVAYVKIKCGLTPLVAPSVGIPENFIHREAMANDV